jgi:cytochrome d ubiquinol oxidase subunit II
VPETWYGIVVFMLTAYVVFDGFDLGAGVLHLYVARNDAERRQVLAAIGPYWDGNEVWLLAAGGALFVGFPRVLSSGISGFYFAIFLVLWSLILRGVSIELRSHVKDMVWRKTWDAGFAVGSVLLPVFFGAALGNLIRGVPLDADGWFELTLFTDFTPAPPVGILDWYTVLVGVFALAALGAHGGAYLVWRTDGPVQERSRRAARVLFSAVAVLWIAATIATRSVNPDLLAALPRRPLALLLAAAALFGLAGALVFLARGRDLAAFLSSCAFVGGLSVATAVCVWPAMLRATPDPARSLTALNAGGDPAGLHVALRWLAVGLPFVAAYYVFLFRFHRGKAAAAADGEGY